MNSDTKTIAKIALRNKHNKLGKKLAKILAEEKEEDLGVF